MKKARNNNKINVSEQTEPFCEGKMRIKTQSRIISLYESFSPSNKGGPERVTNLRSRINFAVK